MRRCILQESTLFDLDLGVWHKMLPNTLHIVWPMHLQSFKLLHPTVSEDILLQENTVFDVGLWFEVTQNVAQYPLHHVTYAPAKFEVATSNSLGRDPLQENTLFNLWHKHRPVPSTLCDLCICKVWSCYDQWFRRRHNYKKHDRLTDTQTDVYSPTLVRN